MPIRLFQGYSLRWKIPKPQLEAETKSSQPLLSALIGRIKQLECQLQECELRWKFAVEGAGDGLWDWNMVDNSVFFSKKWKEILGFGDDEVGNSLDEWERRIHPDDKAAALAVMQAYIEGKTPVYSSEHRVKCKDGSYKWILDRGMVVSRDAKGNPLRIVGTHSDISARKQIEETREEALTRLYKIAGRLPGMVYQYRLRLDGSSCFPYASDAIRDIFRLSPEQVCDNADSVLARFHPDDYDGILASIGKSAKNLTPWLYEYRVRFDDGCERWLLGNALPQREADGATLWHGFITDITGRKQMEGELRNSHALNDSILNSLGTHIAVLDKQGIIVAVNKAWRRFAREHGVTKSAASMLGVNYLQACSNAFNEPYCVEASVAQAGIAAVLAGAEETFDCEYACHSQDQQRWFQMSVVPLQDPQLGVVISHRDITELKQAQQIINNHNKVLGEKVLKQSRALTATNLSLMNKVEQLRRSNNQLQDREARLNSIFNASVEGIITIDANDVIVAANRAVETIFGYAPTELIGCRIRKLIPDSPRDIYAGDSKNGNIGDEIHEIEGRRKDGILVPLDLTVAGYAVNNSFYFTSIVRDVSLRKKRETEDMAHLHELAHVTRLGLMGEMASGIAHEINQPLSAIATYSQVSLNLANQDDPDWAKLVEILSKTQQQALRAGKIIHRMRNFVKSSSKRCSTIDINALVNDAIDLCLPELKQNNVRLTFNLETNLPAVYVDPIQIEQVIINLIRNSVQALQNISAIRQPHLTLQSCRTFDNAIRVEVKDNGPGLDDDQRQRILTPFYTTKANGMGMGLSISRSLVEAHDGSLQFNSKQGKGTTFYFTLPVRDA
ncbi:MAG: PAS domain S-box protein [Methylobacter sp.]|nr:PAS domain S-box protein [Methylobacter sp.]